MGKLSIKGVLLGGIADVLTTNILAIPLVAYVATTINLAQTSKEQMQAAFLSAIHASPLLSALELVIGFACSAFGGYVAARIARRNELLNGACSAWLCMALGIYSLLSGSATESASLLTFDVLAAPAAGLAGGHLRRWQLRAQAARPLGHGPG